MTTVFDDRPCMLGEGPIWHPERNQLYWFDILNRKLMTRTATGPTERHFDELCSAAGPFDRDHLFVASESALSLIDLNTGAKERVVALEADNPITRSNDGRADPWGGFWIGTMGKRAQPDAGAIYRYYRGELRRLYAPLTIPNAISFTPDRRFAHFADTAKRMVWRVALDEGHGWPVGEPEAFIDLTSEKGGPDGAVCDAAGNLWLAHWGAGQVVCYDPTGRPVRAVSVGGRQSSCPAFGGEGYQTLFVTTACEHLTPEVLAAEPQNGCTFAVALDIAGLPGDRVVL